MVIVLISLIKQIGSSKPKLTPILLSMSQLFQYKHTSYVYKGEN